MVDKVPKGCRFALVLLRGKVGRGQFRWYECRRDAPHQRPSQDRRFWQGHFGTKFACAELTFLHQDDRTAYSEVSTKEDAMFFS